MVLVNGKSDESISAFDRGLCYGDGFFETFFCLSGILQNWSYHWKRMQNSAGILRIDIPEESVFLSEFDHLKHQRPMPEECVIKIIVTRGVGGRGYSPANCQSSNRIMAASAMPSYEQMRTRGMNVSILDYRLANEGKITGLKHLNRLNQIFAKMELDDKGSDEGIVCNAKGQVREGTSSNVFMLRGNSIITPPLNDCGVAGVLRNKVVDLAHSICGSHVTEENFTPSDLLNADDVFFTNSLLGVCPVSRMEKRVYKKGRIIQSLIDAKLETDEVK